VTDRSRGEFYLDPNLRLNFDVDVGKAKGVIELRTPFVNPDAGGKDSSPTTGFFSGFQDRTLELKQAYVQIDELFPMGGEAGNGLLLRAGIMDFRKDLRGDGNAFIIDTAGTEHPFDSPRGAPPAYSTGFADSTEAAGGYAAYKLTFLELDGWLFNLDETFNAAIPAAAARRDMLFWGFSGTIPLGKEARPLGKVFLTVFDLMNQSNTHVVTEGGGVTFYPLMGEEVNFVELFGEVYFQQGTYARNASLSGEDIDQKDAFAINAGAKLKAPPMGNRKFTPYVEVSYVEVSGDDNSTDNENSNFVSLENNNRTLVVENGYYGFDIDTNYRGVRAALGFKEKDFFAEILYAYFELQDNSGGRVAGGHSRSPKLGDEIDFTVGYEYSANLKLAFTSGWLLDSHALGQLHATQISLFQIALEF